MHEVHTRPGTNLNWTPKVITGDPVSPHAMWLTRANFVLATSLEGFSSELYRQVPVSSPRLWLNWQPMTEMGTMPRAESRGCVWSKMSLTCVLVCQLLRAQACALSPDVRTGAVVTESDSLMAFPLLLISRGEPQHLG